MRHFNIKKNLIQGADKNTYTQQLKGYIQTSYQSQFS